MSGVPAGRLSIEIVAEIARLQKDLDSAKRLVSAASGDIGRNARAANDNLAGIGKGAGAGVQQFGRDIAALKAQLDPAWAAQQRFNEQQRLGMQAFKVGAIDRQQFIDHMRQINAQLKGEVVKSTRVVTDNLVSMGDALPKASGRNRAALTQLSFQLNDVATMAMSGSGAFQIFATQAGQIVQVVQQAEGGFKGLSMAVLGAIAPFTPLIAAIAAVGGAFALIQSDINKTASVQVSFMDTALGAFDAVKSYLTDQLTSAFATFGISTSDVWSKVVDATKWAINRVIGITSVVPRAIQDTWQLIPAGVADIFYSAVNRAIDAINSLISKSVSGINGFIGQANAILGKANLALPTLTTPQIAKLENSYAGAGTKLGTALAKSIGQTMSRDFIGDMASAISPFAQARARKRAENDAKKAGKAAGSQMGKAAGEKAVEDFLSVWERKMVGDLATTLFKNQAADWKKFNDALENVVADGIAQAADATERARREAETYADSLAEVVSQLGQMGKLGKGLGGLLGLVSGNTRNIAGPLGDLLNIGLTTRDDTGEKVASTIGDELTKVFKKDGPFAKMLQNAGTGMVASSLLFGKQSKEQLSGAAAGGALGGKLAEKALAKGFDKIAQGLGDFAGPLGSIAGGILGSVVGGLFTKAKWGRVDLSASGVSDTAGNSKTSQKAALAAGNSILGGLQDLARQFGGGIGDFGNISVGVRNGDYRVNTGGTSLKVKKGAVDFNDDAEAAVAYAMKMAIERGAINGIRQSTNTLLQAGDDLATQINKALSFEGAFSELKSYLDPIGYEIEGLEKEFTSLRTIFAEAGASAEEYAQLEQLLTIKRQEALSKEKDALEDIRSRIAEAQGDEATVKQIARAKELKDALNDRVRAELQQLYAVEDAVQAQNKLTDAQNEAAAAAAQLQDAWKSIGADLIEEVNRIRGLTGSSGASFATLQGQFNAAVSASRMGDMDAARKLVGLSQSLIDAAGNAATSRQELDRIKAQTAATLEGVAQLTGVPASQISNLPTSTVQSDAVSAELRDTRAELERMRSDMMAALATIAGNTGRTARKLDDVTAQSGGNAIAITGAAA